MAKALGRSAIRDYAKSIRSRRSSRIDSDGEARHEISTDVRIRSYADVGAVHGALMPLGLVLRTGDGVLVIRSAS